MDGPGWLRVEVAEMMKKRISLAILRAVTPISTSYGSEIPSDRGKTANLKKSLPLLA